MKKIEFQINIEMVIIFAIVCVTLAGMVQAFILKDYVALSMSLGIGIFAGFVIKLILKDDF